MDFLSSKGSIDRGIWHAILKGSQESYLSKHSLNQDIKNELKRNRTLLRKPTRKESILTTPISHLRDHIEHEPMNLSKTNDLHTNRSASPVKLSRGKLVECITDVSGNPEETGEPSKLHLNLDDPSEVEAAAKLLVNSTNLHDQADILHYLYVHAGLHYEVAGLADVGQLLEEIYRKAMQTKEWSVVRLAAGLLRKLVNSLTSNVADLLVRQKPMTIGLRPTEHFIDNPKNPKELSDIIFASCESDPREAPLVQEIITYLGSFVKSEPNLFTGIMRIRTHFFIIAMREEISRMNRCNEEDAIEYLMEVTYSITFSLVLLK